MRSLCIVELSSLYFYIFMLLKYFLYRVVYVGLGQVLILILLRLEKKWWKLSSIKVYTDFSITFTSTNNLRAHIYYNFCTFSISKIFIWHVLEHLCTQIICACKNAQVSTHLNMKKFFIDFFFVNASKKCNCALFKWIYTLLLFYF